MKHRLFPVAMIFCIALGGVSVSGADGTPAAVEQTGAGGASSVVEQTVDTYPKTAEEIKQVFRQLDPMHPQGLFDLCEKQDRKLDLSAWDGAFLLKVISRPARNTPGRSAEQIRRDRLSIVEFLLKNGCARTLDTDMGTACAASAVLCGYIDIFNMLLEYGYDVDRTDKSGRNITDYVLDVIDDAKTSTTDGRITRDVFFGADAECVIDPVFEGKLPEANQPLFHAVRRNDPAAVEKAVREKRGLEFINEPEMLLTSMHVQMRLTPRDVLRGQTILYHALTPEHPNPDIVRALIEAGADPSFLGTYGGSALDVLLLEEGHHGKLPKQMEFIPLLWEEYRDRLPEKDWLYAMSEGVQYNADLFRFLLEKGLDPSKPDKRGYAPLERVYRCGPREFVDMMDEMGYRKPFWAAIKWNDTALVREYLLAGKNVNELNSLKKDAGERDVGQSIGYYPLDVAIEANLPEMVELLLENGAFVEPEKYLNGGWYFYPLSKAATMANGEKVTEVLLKHGFKPDWTQPTNNPNASPEQSALFMALTHKRYATAKVLIKYGARTDIRRKAMYSPDETMLGRRESREVGLPEYFRNDPKALDALGWRKGLFDYAGDFAEDIGHLILFPIRTINIIKEMGSPIQ